MNLKESANLLKRLAGTTGLEPATSDVTGRRLVPRQWAIIVVFNSLRRRLAPQTSTLCDREPRG
jgi:hypothetical protein